MWAISGEARSSHCVRTAASLEVAVVTAHRNSSPATLSQAHQNSPPATLSEARHIKARFKVGIVLEVRGVTNIKRLGCWLSSSTDSEAKERTLPEF